MSGLIDWLGLRANISDAQENDLLELIPYFQKMQITDILSDEVLRTKMVINIDKVRSDFRGMVWSITSNGRDKYLNIGASPASLQHGINIFGSLDYHYCKQILINHCKKVLPSVLLFDDEWEVRRIDVTQNFYMDSRFQVKDSLHILRSMDGVRQKATTRGDSVYWGEGSHFRSGKAYDKYVQALRLNKIAIKLGKPPLYSEQQLELMQTILRLELKLDRQFFDGGIDENLLTPEFLLQQHDNFFGKFIGSAEVTSVDKLLIKLMQIAPTEGRARSAYSTYLAIKQNGYEWTKFSMNENTFRKHRQYLKEAGLSEADLTSATIHELRKRRITLQPVSTWQQLEQLHRKVA